MASSSPSRPIRNTMAVSSGCSRLASTMASWNSLAVPRASTALGNSVSPPSPVNLTSRHALGVAHKAKHERYSQCRQDCVEYHAQAGKTAGDLAFGKCPRSCDAMAYDTQCEAACLRCSYAQHIEDVRTRNGADDSRKDREGQTNDNAGQRTGNECRSHADATAL